MGRHRATVEFCDNPACDYDEVVDGEAAYGLHFGKGFEVHGGGGGPIPAFYAHSEECVIPALRAKLEEVR